MKDGEPRLFLVIEDIEGRLLGTYISQPNIPGYITTSMNLIESIGQRKSSLWDII